MKFDPTKKFGVVCGICEEYPGAKYEQRGFLFDAHHKCINPKAVDKESVTLVQQATNDLLEKKSAELTALTEKIVEAQADLANNGSAIAKSKLTKLTNKYEALMAEIDSMGG